MSKFREVDVWETYPSEIITSTNWYWEQEQHHKIVIFPTHTIMNPCINITAVNAISDIPKGVCN